MGEDRPLEIEYDGQTYTGWYRVHGAMITVTGPHGSTTARLGSMASTPETLARMILLADEAEAAALRPEKPDGWDSRIQ